MRKIILDVCGGTGSWSYPYAIDPAYDVRILDLKYGPAGDVVLFKKPSYPVHGILAAPDCTHFSSSGAQYWKEKDQDGRTREAVNVAAACIRLVYACRPVWWCLENPVGRLKDWIGEPDFKFHPWEYGDPYPKKTCLWGNFTIPKKSPVLSVTDPIMCLGGKSEKTKMLRSITPAGFARAFKAANP